MRSLLDELEAMRWLKESAAVEPELPLGVEARLWARVSRDVSALALGGAGATTALNDAASLGSGSWRHVVAAKLAIWSAPALVVGAAAGVAGHATFAPEKTRTVYVDRVVAAPSSAMAVASVESLPLERDAKSVDAGSDDVKSDEASRAGHVEAAAASSRAEPRGDRAAASSSAEPRTGNALSRERAVLDPARAALAAGDPVRTLEQVNRHARTYPNGLLSEEREAIAINALVSLGRYEHARKRAASFRARYPQSLMTHSVDAAMAAVPKD